MQLPSSPVLCATSPFASLNLVRRLLYDLETLRCGLLEAVACLIAF